MARAARYLQNSQTETVKFARCPRGFDMPASRHFAFISSAGTVYRMSWVLTPYLSSGGVTD